MTSITRPIKVVFCWTRIDRDNARWQQAFSLDGKQWETNWIIGPPPREGLSDACSSSRVDCRRMCGDCSRPAQSGDAAHLGNKLDQ